MRRDARLGDTRGALTACGLLLAVGVGVLDDYGVAVDEPHHRATAVRHFRHALGNGALPEGHDRFYGNTFEWPLLAVETVQRALGLGDSRSVYLMRHLLTHLLFLAAGLFCYLLARRLFGDRRLALFALALFVLHPRLYAHSFFNPKDLPFLSLFMIDLYLIHRAMERNTVRAFAVCGAGAGALAGVRLPGAALLPAVLALRAADFRKAAGRTARKHVLTTGAAFTLTGLLVLYGAIPALWRDPIGALVEGLAVLFRHPTVIPNLFQGDLVLSTDAPAHYVPTWFGLTTPPVTLALGLFGTGVALHGGLTRPGRLMRDARRRFGLLLVCCLVLPVLVVVLLRSHVYDGWRQMYFLHAPFCLLAAFGLHRLASAGRPALRSAAYVAAGVGLGSVVVEMVRIHPHQQVYFNLLADRTTPERLRSRYDMDYWRASHLQALEHVLERSAAPQVYVQVHGNLRRSRLLLSEADQRRLRDFPTTRDPDFYVVNHRAAGGNGWEVFPPAVHTRQVYGNTILTVATPDLSLVDDAVAARYRRAYRSAAAVEPVIRSEFDVHVAGKTLTWLKEACRPGDLSGAFFLRVRPADADAAPVDRRRLRRRSDGFVPVMTRWGAKGSGGGFVAAADSLGVKFDGRCMAQAALPDHAVTAIRTGQRRYERPDGWRVLWEEHHRFEDRAPPAAAGPD